ncbi:MAG TPA: glycoside hydrolase family 15 protein [Pseudolysinimonas sp.]|nr:glycoside hydrolase family 15 protein [Pseudolysinimonas sp.]
MSSTLADRAALAAIAAQGAALILSLQDEGGAYPASPTFSAYRGFAWLRDGAFIADGMSAGGHVDSATAFFDWCDRVVTGCADRIERIVAAAASGAPLPDHEMLPARFALDGSLGGGEGIEWWDFQLDGYGLWVWAALAHADRHGIDASRWRRGIELTIDYLVSSWQRPCYDWWEMHIEEIHISTLGSIAAGLRDAARAPFLEPSRASAAAETANAIIQFILRDGTRDGHLIKWVGSQEVDASLAAVVGMLAVIEPSSPVGLTTIAELDRQLAVNGGVHRFLADTFYGGGQWPLLSCMLGLAHAAVGDHDRAAGLLRWSASTAGESGSMPEQVTHHLLDPAYVAEWEERWGTSADPLLWSSAMFLRLAVELGVA